MKKVLKTAILALVAVVIVIFATAFLSEKTTQYHTKLGDNVIISTKADSCSGDVILGRTREIENEIVRLSLADDKLGIAQLVLADSAFMVPNCTHAKVIDMKSSLWQVRITNGEKIGEAGWIPYEWARVIQ